MREVIAVGKAAERDRKQTSGVSERGGYPAGPKTADQLAPPPKGPAPGARSRDTGSSSTRSTSK
jgi:hypothetical protein